MKWRLLILSSCLVATPLAVGRQAEKPFEDAMETGSKKLASPKAIDCGRVAVGQSPRKASECALAAFQAHQSFRVRYDLQGIDSAVASGLVGAPDGKLLATSFDGDPKGRGGISRTRQRFTTVACPEPPSLHLTEEGLLTCLPRTTKHSTFPKLR
jgi:hypothetical protein